MYGPETVRLNLPELGGFDHAIRGQYVITLFFGINFHFSFSNLCGTYGQYNCTKGVVWYAFTHRDKAEN